MTVDEFAVVLRDPKTTVTEEGFYPHLKPRGYWARLERRNQRYWYSVSGTLDRASPTDVADAITSPRSRIDRSEPYNRGRGFEATVRLGSHSYMLGHGNKRPEDSN
jgi:hypothetical protein